MHAVPDFQPATIINISIIINPVIASYMQLHIYVKYDIAFLSKTAFFSAVCELARMFTY